MNKSWGWLLVCAMVLVGNAVFGQENLTLEIHQAWTDAFESETEQDCRLARFTGHLEGLLKIKVPELWKLKVEDYQSDAHPLLSEKHIVGDEFVRILPFEFGDPLAIVLYKNGPKLIWAQEISDVLPLVMLDAYILQTEVAVSDKYVVVIGRLASFNFVRVFSKTNGEIVAHFAFQLDSIKNWGTAKL